MSNEARYLAVNANRLPVGGPVSVYIREGMMDILVDRDQISPRLVAGLSVVSTAIVAGLEPLAVPLDRPWGSVRLDLHDDVAPNRIMPTITPSRILVPVPRALLTPEVAQALEVLGTETMRWYEPPEIS